MVNKIRLSSVLIVVFSSVIACSLPGADESLDEQNTSTALAASLTALVSSSPTQTPSSTATFIPVPTATDMPIVTVAPQAVLVLSATLCWAGPGPVYEVVSALQKTERVVLLGRGSIAGWWIVENPIYHDPCWVMADELQLEPTTNTAALQVFTPPPTPTASFTPLPTATYTYTPTPTHTPTP